MIRGGHHDVFYFHRRCPQAGVLIPRRDELLPTPRSDTCWLIVNLPEGNRGVSLPPTRPTRTAPSREPRCILPFYPYYIATTVKPD